MKKIKFVVCCSVLFLANALIKAGAAENEYRSAPITEPLGARYVDAGAVPDEVGRLILYRLSSGAGVIGVEVNQRYHTSLQPGGFSQACFKAPMKMTLTSRPVRLGDQVGDYSKAITLDLDRAQAAYVRVANVGDGQTTVELVDKKIARSELEQMRTQNHVVSRVPGVVACESEAKVAVAPVALEPITLGTDGLFAFGKADMGNLSVEGRNSLDRLIDRLKKQYGNFEKTKINVVGHADPLGSSVVNQQLSARRAQAVRAYMLQAGIDGRVIASEGRGASQPVVTQCAKEITPQSILCNKPNRRVVVEVVVSPR